VVAVQRVGRMGTRVAGAPRGEGGDAGRARAAGVSPSVPASAGFCAPAPGGGTGLGEPGVGSGGAGWLGAPSFRSGLVPQTPSPVVDRLLGKWSLASSAPNPVEVSMRRKLCDTGVRKRLAGTGRGSLKGLWDACPPFLLLPRNSRFWKGEFC
jgi:hypothetical protein